MPPSHSGHCSDNVLCCHCEDKITFSVLIYVCLIISLQGGGGSGDHTSYLHEKNENHVTLMFGLKEEVGTLARCLKLFEVS